MSEHTWEGMVDIPGKTMTFTLERTAEAILRDSLDRTMSAAGIGNLMDQIGLWVGTRIARSWQRTHIAPQAVRVRVTVTVTELGSGEESGTNGEGG